MNKIKRYITIIGSSMPSSQAQLEIAEQLGYQLAKKGYIIVTGGKGGIMKAASKGAKKAGGTTIGILPESHRMTANPYVDYSIPTGIGHARNAINVLSGDAIVVVGGGPGTLSEIGLALAYGKPVIAIKNSGGVAELLAGKKINGHEILQAETIEEVVKIIEKLFTK